MLLFPVWVMSVVCQRASAASIASPRPASVGPSLALTSTLRAVTLAPPSMSIAAPTLKATHRASVQPCISIFVEVPASKAPIVRMGEGGREGAAWAEL